MSAEKKPITIDRLRDMYSWATGWKPDVDPETPHMADVQAGLRAEFDAALAAHDAEKRAEWEAEQGETEYIVRDHYGGLWTLTSSLDEARHYVLREPGTVMEQRKVTPWLPVPGSTVRESDSGVRDSDSEESEGKA